MGMVLQRVCSLAKLQKRFLPGL